MTCSDRWVQVTKTGSAVESLLNLVPSQCAAASRDHSNVQWPYVDGTVHQLEMSSKLLLIQEGLAAAPCWLCVLQASQEARLNGVQPGSLLPPPLPTQLSPDSHVHIHPRHMAFQAFQQQQQQLQRHAFSRSSGELNAPQQSGPAVWVPHRHLSAAAFSREQLASNTSCRASQFDVSTSNHVLPRPPHRRAGAVHCLLSAQRQSLGASAARSSMHIRGSLHSCAMEPGESFMLAAEGSSMMVMAVTSRQHLTE